MIIYTDTNIFLSPAQTLVNTVNTVGVMGKGIAKEFKKYYPEMFTHYKKLCIEKKFTIGQLLIHNPGSNNNDHFTVGQNRQRWVLNFPTKQHWRGKSRLEYLEAGLDKFVKTYRDRGIRSISFPQLGVGNGGLKWAEVKPLMESYLMKVDIPVYIHIYHTNTDHYDNGNKKTIEKNLNTPHDYWRCSDFLRDEGFVKDNDVNIDGIIMPNTGAYDKAKRLSNIKYLPTLSKLEGGKAIWLQNNSKLKKTYIQMTLEFE